jgi:hypothetical protein
MEGGRRCVRWPFRAAIVGAVQVMCAVLGLGVAIATHDEADRVAVAWLFGAAAFGVLAVIGSGVSWRRMRRELPSRALPPGVGEPEQERWQYEVWRAARFQVPFIVVIAVVAPLVTGFVAGTGLPLLVTALVVRRFEQQHGITVYSSGRRLFGDRAGLIVYHRSP